MRDKLIDDGSDAPTVYISSILLSADMNMADVLVVALRAW